MLRKRLRYYIGTYIMGYIICLMNVGVPNLYYLIPLKLPALAMMLVLGNGFYYIAEEKAIIFEATARSIKYVILSAVLIMMSILLSNYLKNYQIDISPFIGM